MLLLTFHAKLGMSCQLEQEQHHQQAESHHRRDHHHSVDLGRERQAVMTLQSHSQGWLWQVTLPGLVSLITL